MSDILLRECVYNLAYRFSWLGIGAEVSALSYRELEGLYRFLSRLESGG